MKFILIIFTLFNLGSDFSNNAKANSRKAKRRALTQSDPCKLNLSWGHGSSSRVESDLNRKKIKGKSIFQGCGVGGQGDIKYQAFQGGFNGDWMDSDDIIFIDNAGFTPIMTLEGYKIMNRNSISSVNDISYDDIFDFNDLENAAITRYSHKYKVYRGDIHKALLRIGFMRLTHYNWAALMKEAQDLLPTKENPQSVCKEVKIEFVCHSDYKGSVHGRLGQRVYDRRLMGAQFYKRNKDNKFIHQPKLEFLTDPFGQKIKYEVKTCASSKGGKSLNSVPLKCGESHLIDREVFEAYQDGDCGSFLNNVDTKYKNQKKILDAGNLFDVELGTPVMQSKQLGVQQ